MSTSFAGAATAADLLACAECHDGASRIVGNVRADSIARMCREYANARAEISRLTAELGAARAVTVDVCRYLDCSESDLLAVVTSLYESRARAISDATAARGTVGGLLATAPVGSIVECSFMRSHRQVRATGFESIEQRWYADGAWSDWYSLSYQFIAFQLPARLVPAAEADADPDTRGPLPTAAPRCSCTHEAGDSICDAHPSCSECGDSTSRNVDDCADHCQVCASLRRGDAITDWTATCQACKSRGPLPKGG